MNWRGLEKVKMIWHWTNSDAELECNWIVANYWDIENCLFEWFKEEKEEQKEWDKYRAMTEQEQDKVFNEWLKENKYQVEELFENYNN